MRIKRPDKKNAQSILNAARRELDYTLTLNISEESASTIIRNIYESFRMLGDALLVYRGIKSIDHVLPIKELLSLKVQTLRPVNVIGNLRKTRHNINYYGYKPNISEVEDAVSIANNCFEPLFDAASKKINKN